MALIEVTVQIDRSDDLWHIHAREKETGQGIKSVTGYPTAEAAISSDEMAKLREANKRSGGRERWQ